MSKSDPDPSCSHERHGVIITNQPGDYDSSRSHRSTWVCGGPECVLDAMAWVRRGTGEKPWWRAGTAGGWHDEMYDPETAVSGREDER